MKRQAQAFCKEYKLKLVEMTSIGFVASKAMPIKAGMETDINTGRLISIPIRKIGTKHILQNFMIHSDGDIQQVCSQN